MTRIRLADLGYLHGQSHPIPAYIGPPWPQPAPDHYEHAVDVICFYRDTPEATCSVKVAGLLAQLRRDWGAHGQ